MEDKLNTFFSDNNFDLQEPQAGHLERFERKLNRSSNEKKYSWKWLSVAASIVLLIGFYLGSLQQPKTFDLADVSPKMEEVQNYFIRTINQELKTIEKNRSLNTETVIESALNELEELEESYALFVEELNKNRNQAKIINAMIKNYQQRLQILENVLQQIEQIKNPKIIDNETFI
ncbi:MAG: hypothetical protein HWD82_04165 [Flavobacteriaceae bacterium]|nr:hypothetical protein [Flavobacteriaceae bacterium]